MDEMVGFLKSKQGSLVNIRELVFASTVNILGNICFSKDLIDLDGDRKERKGLKRALYRICFHESTPPEGPTATFPISSTVAQVLAGFAILLCSSGGGRIVVPAGRSTPEMKASSNNPKKVKIAQETFKLVVGLTSLNKQKRKKKVANFSFALTFIPPPFPFSFLSHDRKSSHLSSDLNRPTYLLSPPSPDRRLAPLTSIS
ncbi:hypothetical protein L1887_12564 [Cichorium endivia]|nr:hypothetical protein L1887_12564 [Cichorium endivia]